MKLIIAGSRTIEPTYQLLLSLLDHFKIIPSEIVSGGARGVDESGEMYANLHELPCKYFLSNWEQHGKSAGFKRNLEMAKYADALLAIWDGKSKGTKHMMDIMYDYGKPVYMVVLSAT